jgi:DNA-binding NtrC family response regulator
MEQMERYFLEQKLAERKWNRKKTARDLGICYRTLLYKIARLKLRPPTEAEPTEDKTTPSLAGLNTEGLRY